MKPSQQVLINHFLETLFQHDPLEAVHLLETTLKENDSPFVEGMIRLASLRPEGSTLYYQKLYNIWSNLNRPSLKPNATNRKIFLLTDFTADNFPPLISLFCAAHGINVELELAPFDSIEQFAFSGSPGIMNDQIVVLIISPQWLQRYLGESALISRKDLDKVKELFSSVIDGIKSQNPSHIMVANFPGPLFSLPGGTLSLEEHLGYNLAVAEFNRWLGSLTSPNLHLLDIAEAILGAGGRKALAQTNYFRAGMFFDPKGAASVSREIALAMASVCGKTHRALVVDWDNTLWGGEVAELGWQNIVCGPDSPEGRGFLSVQKYVKDLTGLGALLAGVSRNSSEVKNTFQENKNMALTLDDFSSVQVSFNPKSASVETVSSDLGFGEEFMVFMDDSLFELAEVFTKHPNIDLLLAGPDPVDTLRNLTESRLFNTVLLSEADRSRFKNSKILKKQRELKSSFKNIDDFLKTIDIRLTIYRLEEKNKSRTIQLLQKSNQFNLTTKRYGEVDLAKLEKNDGDILVVSYEDAFGSQGIISVVILVSSEENVCIDSWVMSCRVLNRTVEQAIFSYILKISKGKTICGEYIPTEKNGLVRSLYKTLGFEKLTETSGDNKDSEQWVYANYDPEESSAKHHVSINEM